MTILSRFCSKLMFSALLLGLSVFTLVTPAQKKPAAKTDAPRYKDAALPVADRVADLILRMTLEEKVDQLKWDWQQKVEVIDPTGTYTSETARKALAAEWGGDLNLTPRNAAILRNAIQRYQIEKTRLGIPVIFPGEALHGYMEYGSTSFPQALGLGLTQRL